MGEEDGFGERHLCGFWREKKVMETDRVLRGFRERGRKRE